VITTQASPQPADFTDVRATNLAVVMRYVRLHAPCSRADIAASTGLNKATVSSLVAELMRRRLLRETGVAERRIGRPAIMLVLDGAPYAAIGLAIGTDHLSAVAIDLAGVRLLGWRRGFTGTGVSPSKAVAMAVGLARRAVSRVRGEGRQVLGLTVAVPGLVDGQGVVRLATHLGWRDVPLRAELTRALGNPGYAVAVENDANLAVLAEYRYGPHAGTANLAHLTGHAGIGAGIIADGRLLRGGLGYPGEIGHLPVRAGGPTCSCGRVGCLEAVAGAGALVARLCGADPAGDLAPEVDDLVRRARAGEPAVRAELTAAGRDLGYAASVLANLLNPDVILLGGYLAVLSPWLLDAATTELRDRVFAPDAGGTTLQASTLGLDATATGGAASVLDRVDAGRLPATS
jgi:predicted NBD/HSP70 family sugar kinase